MGISLGSLFDWSCPSYFYKDGGVKFIIYIIADDFIFVFLNYFRVDAMEHILWACLVRLLVQIEIIAEFAVVCCLWECGFHVDCNCSCNEFLFAFTTFIGLSPMCIFWCLLKLLIFVNFVASWDFAHENVLTRVYFFTTFWHFNFSGMFKLCYYLLFELYKVYKFIFKFIIIFIYINFNIYHFLLFNYYNILI